MSGADRIILQASAVAVDGRALLIEGAPGIGKSSLALALIDRGAALIGDDGVTLERRGTQVLASPPPNIAGLLEVHGVGLIELPVVTEVPVALILSLGQSPERMPENIPAKDILGAGIPALPFDPGNIAPALRAEWALANHGLKPG